MASHKLLLSAAFLCASLCANAQLPSAITSDPAPDANMAGGALPIVKANQQEAAIPGFAKRLAAEGIAPLAGCTPESLVRNLLAHAVDWNLPDLAPKLARRPILVISSDDGFAPATDALVANLRKLGDTQVRASHLATDHAYSDHRIALQRQVLSALEAAHIR